MAACNYGGGFINCNTEQALPQGVAARGHASAHTHKQEVASNKHCGGCCGDPILKSTFGKTRQQDTSPPRGQPPQSQQCPAQPSGSGALPGAACATTLSGQHNTRCVSLSAAVGMGLTVTAPSGQGQGCWPAEGSCACRPGRAHTHPPGCAFIVGAAYYSHDIHTNSPVHPSTKKGSAGPNNSCKQPGACLPYTTTLGITHHHTATSR